MNGDDMLLVQYTAGRLASSIVWPDPDLLDPPGALLSHLVQVVAATPRGLGVAALAAAIPVTAALKGDAGDLTAAVAAVEDGTEWDRVPEYARLGHDLGVGFCRQAWDGERVGNAVEFLSDELDRLTGEQRDNTTAAAVTAVVALLLLAW